MKCCFLLPRLSCSLVFSAHVKSINFYYFTFSKKADKIDCHDYHSFFLSPNYIPNRWLCWHWGSCVYLDCDFSFHSFLRWFLTMQIFAHFRKCDLYTTNLVVSVQCRVWSGHTCSRTQIWSPLQHRLTQIQTGRACECCVCVCLQSTNVPGPIAWLLCAGVAVASSRRASWMWCLRVSVGPQVLLWWCPRVVFQGRWRGCSQAASSPAGQPWWVELKPDGPEG